MTAHQSLRIPGAARPGRRTIASAAACAGAALALSACGGGGSHQAAASSSASASARSGSCAGVPGANHARVVIETSPSSVVSRCVGFSSATIAGTALLSEAHVALGTQKYSFGLAICAVNGVPAHYSQCLPSGKPYWAMFVSRDGATWTSPSTGISDTTLQPGDSLGLRYDSPTGNPAPPPPPSPA